MPKSSFKVQNIKLKYFWKIKTSTTNQVLGENFKHMPQGKVAQNVAIFLGYFNFSKNHYKLPKVAQKPNIAQSGHNVCA
jgi:hypothetical protein